MLALQDLRENQGHRVGWALQVHRGASSADQRGILVQTVLLVPLGRPATDFLVQRVTEDLQARLVQPVPKETASPAQWGLLVCPGFQENPAQKGWASPDPRETLDSEGYPVYLDLQVKAFKDLRETQDDLVHRGQQGHKD